MRHLVAAFSACLIGVPACGDNVVPPADAGPSALFTPAPHTPLPMMLPHAGAVLSSVELVTMTYDGYAARADVEAFGDMIVGSSWFTSAGAEYNVGAGQHVQKLSLGAAPTTLSRADVRNLVTNLIAAGSVPSPTPDSQLLYLLYVPPTVAFSDPEGPRSYHEMMVVSGARFSIAVVLDTDSNLADTTVTAAHELIDAVTDPYVAPRDGYYSDPPSNDPWTLVFGEVAELCEGELPVIEGSYSLPRVYSNIAAAAGHSPCRPFVPDDSWYDVSAAPAQLQQVPAGGKITFTLTGWSTKDVGAWRLHARAADRSALSTADMRPELSSDLVSNGTIVRLTLHAPAEALPGTVGGVYVLSGPTVRPWAVGFVVQ